MRAVLRRLRRQEDGMTLVELLVSMMILGIAMTMFGTTLASVQNGIVQQDRFSRANDSARLALEQIDRQMRSGNVLYDPASEGTATSGAGAAYNNYMVRIYTQTNADTLGYTCVQWRITTSNQLQTRSWPPEDTANVTSWRTVADGIVNKSLGVPAFALDSDPLKGNRVLNVTLRVSVDPNVTTTSATEIQAAFTGRNTAYGYPSTVCSSPPAA
jgi:prepilin-type N-terminal cleavage/methylation domain-containing protein